jgi:hypothetical protein
LADPTPGYPELSQIEFLPTVARFYPKEKELALESFSIVRVLSLSPQTRFQRSLSWKIRAGGTRIRDDGCPGCFAPDAELGVGVAFPFMRDGLTFYFMSDTHVAYDPAINGIRHSGMRAGIGPSGGFRARFSENLLWVGSGHWYWLPTQSPVSTWSAETTFRWQYTHDFAFGFEARKQPLSFDGQLASWIYF